MTSMGTDWRDSQIRYLVHFDDGGSGMRHRPEPLAAGDKLADGGCRSRNIVAIHRNGRLDPRLLKTARDGGLFLCRVLGFR